MVATFVAYIDESGDEGFSFGKGSSEWFVLAGTVTRKVTDLATVKLVDQVRSLLGKPPKKPLHFRDLKHHQRLPFIGEIAQVDLRAISILIHKRSIKEPEKFHERYRLYFYAVRLLLERISWYCRDHVTARDAGDGSVEIIFSSRSGMSYEELKGYLSHLEKNAGAFDVRIDWSVIKADQMTAYSPGRQMGLQIADAIAGAFFLAVEPVYGYTEDRYARMLKPVVYHRNGRYLGYGLKFWPQEVNAQIEEGDIFQWVRKTYK